MVDRYTKCLLAMIALALSMLAIRSFPYLAISQAGELPGVEGPRVTTQEPITIPRSWGRFVAASAGGSFNSLLFFEAADGTIRAKRVSCGATCEYARK